MARHEHELRTAVRPGTRGPAGDARVADQSAAALAARGPASSAGLVALQRAAGNRTVNRTLSHEAVGGEAVVVHPTVRSGQRQIQRVISTDQFVDDTTSSFLCISWRKGDEAERAEMERLLGVFESARDILAQVKALDAVTGKARQLNAGDRSAKFKAACQRIQDEGQVLWDKLTTDPKYIEMLGAEKRAQDEAAERAEALRLAGLKDLGRDARVDAFTKRYGGALLPTLLAGTDLLVGDAAVLRLAQNFANIGFTYTMRNSNFTALLGGTRKGDCNTLSKAMQAICKEILLLDATVEGIEDLLVPSNERTIDAAKDPNAEGGAFWIFENHYWVQVNGKRYDPLFGRAYSDAGWHPLSRKRVFDEMAITMEDYGGEYRMVLLHGVGNKRIGQVSRKDWDQHKAGVRTDVQETYEEMVKKVLA